MADYELVSTVLPTVKKTDQLLYTTAGECQQLQMENDMSFKNFKEYLAERNKHPHGVVSDDKGFANRDYDGDLSLKPKPGKYLHPEEYYAPGANKNPGLMTADGSDRGQPFGDMATPGLNPKNSAPWGQKPVDKTKKVGGKKKKKLPTKKAMKVEHFLDKTSKMSDVQFAKHLLEDVKQVPTPKVRDLYGKEYTPEPAQTMKYVTHLMLTNENMMRRMVRELKRNDGLHLLIAEVLQHPETYDCLNEAARGNLGEVAERKLAMFFEGVSPPRAGGGGPASAGAPGGGGGQASQGGAFGGGGAGQGVGGMPGAGLMGGMDNGGGDTISGGAAGGAGGMGGAPPGGMPGMGEEEMMPGMGGEEGGDPDEEHLDDDDEEDDGMNDEDDDDDDESLEDDEDDDDEDDDDDDEDGDDEDDDHQDMMGGGGPAGAGMGMGGMGGPGMAMGMGGMGM